MGEAMKKASILLVGAGGHARVCIDVIEREGHFAIAGLVGLAAEVGNRVLGYPVLGTDKNLTSLLTEHAHALVAVGQIKTPEPRMRIFELLERSSCASPPIISPQAYVSPHATLGAGTIVMPGAVINAGASVGRNCIINSQALVEHDAIVEDHCHIATAAVINGGTVIGTGTFIGSGSVVRESVQLRPRCVIGMGQRILKDCADGSRIPQFE
jgi:sugar O-acyltransferase (sialic acid O-acetyltransferase NeuD family)